MNVLFLCWEYPPSGAGIGRYVAEMATALSESGHRAVVLTSRVEEQPETELAEGVLIRRLFNRDEIRSSRVAQLAADLAREHKADWIEGAEHWGECSALLRLRSRPPVVVKMHYNDVLRTARHAQAWYSWQRPLIDLACWRQWRSIRAERYSIEHADVLLAPCRRIIEEGEQQGLALPECRAVVPNPIRAMENWVNREAEEPTLLLVGRLDIGKGLPYIRGLLEQLTRHIPRLRLEVAGGDSYARGLGSLKRWLERRLGPLAPRVAFLGVLNRRELDEAYRRAWVSLVPSRWDTFPQVVLEAMVRGKAIVASPHGGMPEMLGGTHNAIADPATADFADAVLRFLQNPALRLQAGAEGREVAKQQFAPRVIADQYVATIGAMRRRGVT